MHLTGCSSFTVIVGKDGAPSLVYDGFKECPGTTFQITLKQKDNSTTAQGTVAAGSVKFGGLRGIDSSGLVDSLEIVSDSDCGPFKKGMVYRANAIVLKPLRDPKGQPVKDAYVVDVESFK